MSDASQSSARAVTSTDEVIAIHEQLLEPAFPASELVPPEWLAEAVASGDASMLVSQDDTGPLATAVTERLGPSGSVLLSYFATREDMRGRGVGSRLFAEMLEALRTTQTPSLIVAEVERPDGHSGSVEFGDPTARLRFYGRHGATALDLPYYQPPIDDDTDAVHGMLLLVLWADPALVLDTPDGPALSGPHVVADVIEAILDSSPAGETPEGVRLHDASLRPTVRLYAVQDYQQIVASR